MACLMGCRGLPDGIGPLCSFLQLAACPAGQTPCGSLCIDRTTQCRASQTSAGKTCATGTFCTGDGGICSPPPSEEAVCDA